MKTCSRCKETKPPNDFYRCKRAKDGLQPWCKLCHRNYYREYVRNDAQKLKQKAYLDTPNAKIMRKGVRVRYALRNPEKAAATRAVNAAVRKGSLPRISTQMCFCGKKAGHYHHADYSKPLDVTPMCPSCHAATHRQ